MILDPFLKSQPASYRHDIDDCEAFYWIYLRKGRLWLQDAHRKERLGAGDLLILPTSSSFSLWTEAKTGYSGVSFTVLPSTPMPWSGKLPQVFRGAAVIGQLAELLASSLEDKRSMEFCRHLARALLEESRSLSEEARSNNLPDLRQALPEAIAEAIKRCVYGGEKIEAILKRSGLSIRQAERVFKLRYGMSAKSFLMAQRLAQARLWLLEQGMPVSAVARELGFSSAAHFSLWFKKETGSAPAKWRESFENGRK
ncbi:MAG: AraC family transcriptional regulator [Spirochaetia bacterium]|nr:AraC family transcriptional regulator [Spirochaetia bacterium]